MRSNSEGEMSYHGRLPTYLPTYLLRHVARTSSSSSESAHEDAKYSFSERRVCLPRLEKERESTANVTSGIRYRRPWGKIRSSHGSGRNVHDTRGHRAVGTRGERQRDTFERGASTFAGKEPVPLFTCLPSGNASRRLINRTGRKKKRLSRIHHPTKILATIL